MLDVDIVPMLVHVALLGITFVVWIIHVGSTRITWNFERCAGGCGASDARSFREGFVVVKVPLVARLGCRSSSSGLAEESRSRTSKQTTQADARCATTACLVAEKTVPFRRGAELARRVATLLNAWSFHAI